MRRRRQIKAEDQNETERWERDKVRQPIVQNQPICPHCRHTMRYDQIYVGTALNPDHADPDNWVPGTARCINPTCPTNQSEPSNMTAPQPTRPDPGIPEKRGIPPPPWPNGKTGLRYSISHGGWFWEVWIPNPRPMRLPDGTESVLDKNLFESGFCRRRKAAERAIRRAERRFRRMIARAPEGRDNGQEAS